MRSKLVDTVDKLFSSKGQTNFSLWLRTLVAAAEWKDLFSGKIFRFTIQVIKNPVVKKEM